MRTFFSFSTGVESDLLFAGVLSTIKKALCIMWKKCNLRLGTWALEEEGLPPRASFLLPSSLFRPALSLICWCHYSSSSLLFCDPA